MVSGFLLAVIYCIVLYRRVSAFNLVLNTLLNTFAIRVIHFEPLARLGRIVRLAGLIPR